MTRRTQAINITEQWLLGESCSNTPRLFISSLFSGILARSTVTRVRVQAWNVFARLTIAETWPLGPVHTKRLFVWKPFRKILVMSFGRIQLHNGFLVGKHLQTIATLKRYFRQFGFFEGIWCACTRRVYNRNKILLPDVPITGGLISGALRITVVYLCVFTCCEKNEKIMNSVFRGRGLEQWSFSFSCC